ncbi:hypothetical protein SFUL_6481 [Streptomyces microflavus DSM 40593]|uniref:Uncharacterized protein n=1 Tax=Streptomyces microflavus DSM 40593 TaxID=1303692 RepID=N0D5P1_STRMI|nr:hypothetical protein SFUL_6481 [Streptomyces microflavus DSM 40593]
MQSHIVGSKLSDPARPWQAAAITTDEREGAASHGPTYRRARLLRPGRPRAARPHRAPPHRPGARLQRSLSLTPRGTPSRTCPAAPRAAVDPLHHR